MNRRVDFAMLIRMLHCFKTVNLQLLLNTFGQHLTGEKSKLLKRAIQLLETKITGINYPEYKAKIIEIYQTVQIINLCDNSKQVKLKKVKSMDQKQIPSKKVCQASQLTHQSINNTSTGLPYIISHMQNTVYINPNDANTIPGSSTANSSTQNAQSTSTASHTVVSSQLPPKPESIIKSSLTLNPQFIEYVEFKSLPFYEVIENIINLTYLTSLYECSLENAPNGINESRFSLTLSPKQASIISLNRDISNGKNEYPFQCQIRICQLRIGCDEVSDYLPMGLHIRIENKYCPLPPCPRNMRPGFVTRRTAGPINCTHQLLLSPIVSNEIKINWTPDKNNYALAMYIVKKISVDTLVKKLKGKEAKSSEKTKSDIIKKLANFDPDLTVTHDIFSLICPLSKTRMKLPAKSIYCNHLQCFDAKTFIIMNEKKATWKCPICKISCLYDDIQIESYFLEVVTSSKLNDNDQEIILCADGSWKNISKENMKDNLNAEINIIDHVNLDSDDEQSNEPLNKPMAGGSKSQQSEKSKTYFVDLTLGDDGES
ncbi:E3 SUMO-protein ligase PIAS2-like [Melanaphis sacchari]|uniref:E3 SUMO-protein ligase PIAS2 n=1 Tax=Melanaphis sacchari TaxID=742174 RepID=A0A2H8TQK5_9HEMI|nr:E3 SUMO-protein ligase PIAS2-like [Melanaphis sacchari]